ncbi:unnamed protein product [Symbiodinium microadriaticum]|nr:unnamed protein product [Symbiodinium microadriaticum]
MSLFSVGNRVRFFAALCLALGLSQAIYGVKAFQAVKSTPFGAWWAGIMIMIASVAGLCVYNNWTMATVMGLSIAAVIMGFAGAILDGIGYAYINSLHACSNTDFKTWGDSAYYAAAIGCMVTNQGDNNDCACVKQNYQQSSDPDCLIFALYGDDDDCGSAIIDLPPVLQTSYILALVASVVVLVMSVMSCGSICCPGHCGKMESNC